jgi:Tfp pilus assembly protein PilP
MVKIGITQIRKRMLDGVVLSAVLMGWVALAPAVAAQGKTKKPAKVTRKSAVKAPAAKAPTSYRASEGLRDPFKLPPPPSEGPQTSEAPIGPLPPGSRGLIIGELKLEGIVRQGKENPKMIAVLANPANRAYFLHENDPLYNGVITKITPDSVYFKEDVRDAAGKITSREVVKKLAPAPGEKK